VIAVWILVRIAYDCVTWQYRETTVRRLEEEMDYKVDRVVDACTLVVSSSAQHERALADLGRSGPSTHRARVSLLGVAAAPAGLALASGNGDPSAAAARFTRELVAEGPVHMQLDRRRTRRDGVLLAYVFVGPHMLNEELIGAGWALAAPEPGDSPSMANRLRRAQAEARQARRGIWRDHLTP
jgi:endonuclease YncB( thermonuclease family)